MPDNPTLEDRVAQLEAQVKRLERVALKLSTCPVCDSLLDYVEGKNPWGSDDKTVCRQCGWSKPSPRAQPQLVIREA